MAGELTKTLSKKSGSWTVRATAGVERREKKGRWFGSSYESVRVAKWRLELFVRGPDQRYNAALVWFTSAGAGALVTTLENAVRRLKELEGHSAGQYQDQIHLPAAYGKVELWITAGYGSPSASFVAYSGSRWLSTNGMGWKTLDYLIDDLRQAPKIGNELCASLRRLEGF